MKKPPLLTNHDPGKPIGCFTATGVEFTDGLTPENFRLLAYAIAGPHWRTRLGPMIGKCRSQVWEYASGKRAVPATVAKLMRVLAATLGATSPG